MLQGRLVFCDSQHSVRRVVGGGLLLARSLQCYGTCHSFILRSPVSPIHAAAASAFQAALRALRIVLRDVTAAAMAQPRWRSFAEPPAPEEDLGYYETVTHPMDLATLLSKIDGRGYLVPTAYLADAQLIVQASAHAA